MITDLQKASLAKRISAYILDMILLVIVVVGLGSIISQIIGFDDNGEKLEAYYAQYEESYGVTFEMTEEEYYAMTEEELAQYNAAYEALIADEDAMYTYNLVITQTLMIVSLSILIGYLATEFAVPLVLGNGQTVGKKIFSLAVVRTNSVKINGVCLFIRTLLGKYTIETMIPVLVVIMLLFNVTGIMGTLLVLAIGIAQIVIMAVTKTNSVIHDLLADTVVVDMASQMIFNSDEELLEYKKRMSAENAAQASYF